MFGQTLEWWNHAMLVSLAFAAVAAIAVAFATTVVVKLTALEEQEAKEALEMYKKQAEENISAANAVAATANAAAAAATRDAAKANLEQERLRAELAWWTIGQNQAAAMMARLRAQPGRIVVEFLQNDLEAQEYAKQFVQVFSASGWQAYTRPFHSQQAAIEGLRVPNSSSVETAIIRSALTTAGIVFRTDMPTPPPGATRLVIGIGPMAPDSAAILYVGTKPFVPPR
jgi:hypothetical protein